MLPVITDKICREYTDDVWSREPGDEIWRETMKKMRREQPIMYQWCQLLLLKGKDEIVTGVLMTYGLLNMQLTEDIVNGLIDE